MADKPTLRMVAGSWLPEQPTFDLATEPWADVVDAAGGQPRHAGLRDVLLDAHALHLDGGLRGPLWVHAAHRFLIALTYLLHAHAPDHPWRDVAVGTAPLPADAIDQVLGRLADHLWLHHPTSPFLQDLSILDVMDGKAHKDPTKALLDSTGPFWALLPDVPSNTNAAWFGRADERPDPAPADAACALLVRHYFALPGNETPNQVAGGRTSKGGVTGLTKHGRSFVTIAGPNLAATLARNLLDDWVDTIGPNTPTFFEQPHAAGSNLHPLNPLWAYTASAAATVLVPTPDLPGPYRAVRTPVPHSQHAAVALATRTNDPHALRVDSTNKAKAKGSTHSYVGLSAAGSELDLARTFYGNLVQQSALHSPTVLGPHSLTYGHARHDVDVLVIDGAGGSAGPRIAGTATYRPPAGTLTIDRERASRYLEIANRVSGNTASASRKVEYRISQVLASANAPSRPSDRDKRHPWLKPACDEQLTAVAEPILRGVLAVCVDPSQLLPAGLNDAEQAKMKDAALAVFDQVVAPHAARPAAIPHVVKQRRALTLDLDRLWS